MVAKCCVALCKNNANTPNIALHNFTKDPKLIQVWVQLTRRDTVKSNRNPRPFKVSKWTKICSAHFQRSDYIIRSEKSILKPNVIPTIFPWTNKDALSKQLEHRPQEQQLQRCVNSIEVHESVYEGVAEDDVREFVVEDYNLITTSPTFYLNENTIEISNTASELSEQIKQSSTLCSKADTLSNTTDTMQTLNISTELNTGNISAGNKQWLPFMNSSIRNVHFAGGKKSENVHSEDYAPTVFSNQQEAILKNQQCKKRKLSDEITTQFSTEYEKINSLKEEDRFTNLPGAFEYAIIRKNILLMKLTTRSHVENWIKALEISRNEQWSILRTFPLDPNPTLENRGVVFKRLYKCHSNKRSKVYFRKSNHLDCPARLTFTIRNFKCGDYFEWPCTIEFRNNHNHASPTLTHDQTILENEESSKRKSESENNINGCLNERLLSLPNPREYTTDGANGAFPSFFNGARDKPGSTVNFDTNASLTNTIKCEIKENDDG